MTINRMPRKGDTIKFDSGGMYPDCDNRFYKVMGKYRNYNDILNIKEIGKDLHTQVIVKSKEGFNNFLHFI